MPSDYKQLIRFEAVRRLGIDTRTEDGARLADEFVEMAAAMPDVPMKYVLGMFRDMNAARIEAAQRVRTEGDSR